MSNHEDPDEFIKRLLTVHHPEAVSRFIHVYSGQPGVGMMKLLINGEECSAVCATVGESDQTVAVFFVIPPATWKIESLDGTLAKNKMIDEDGQEIKSH